LLLPKVAKSLDTFPNGYETTGFMYRGYDIYIKPSDTYLLFYIVNQEDSIVIILRVLKDGMNWKLILKHWLTLNK